MKTKPTVFLVKNEQIYSGGEIHVLDLSKGLKERGYKVVVLTSVPKLYEECQKGGVEAHRTLYPKSNYLIYARSHQNLLGDFPKNLPYVGANLLIYLWHLLRYRPEIVHVHSRDEVILSGLLFSIFSKKLIWTDHADLPIIYRWFRKGSPKKKLLNWFISRHVDKIICVSKALRSEVLEESGLPQDKLTVVYNGIDIPQTKDIANNFKNSKVLGFFGRLHPDKRPDLLLEVLRHLPGSYELLIGGDGPLRASLDKQIASFGGRVKLLGFVENKSDFFARIGVYVSTAQSEPFGRSITEAMARGIPVVATAVGGVTEQIKDRANGLLVDGPTPEEVAKKIQLLQDEKLYNRLSAEARKSAQRFKMSEFISKTLEIYGS